MVLEINAQFHTINKFVVSFLSTSDAPQELIDAWKDKHNLNKLKSTIRKTEQPANPPRPKSKYIFFCDTVRQEIKQEHPEMGIREITCELGRRWQQFKMNPDPVIEEKLARAFEQDKNRYDTEKLAKTTDVQKNKFRSKYLYFCEQERTREPKITMKELGNRWNAIKNDPSLFERYSASFEVKKKQHDEAVEKVEEIVSAPTEDAPKKVKAPRPVQRKIKA